MSSCMKMMIMKLAAQLFLVLALASGTLARRVVEPEPPTTGFLESFIEGDFGMGNTFCVSANDGSKKPDDLRDEHSYYANIRNSCQRRTIFEFQEVLDNIFVIKAVDIRTKLGPTANGWYLSVLDDRDSDNAGGPTGDLRVVLQPDLNAAAVWEFSDEFGKSVITVFRNPGLPGTSSLGRSLAVAEAPFRSGESFYLAVTADFDRALDIRMIEEAVQ